MSELPDMDTLREAILAAHLDGTLLAKIFGDYSLRSGPAGEATTDALAALHNEGQLDVVTLLDAGIPSGAGAMQLTYRTCFAEDRQRIDFGAGFSPRAVEIHVTLQVEPEIWI